MAGPSSMPSGSKEELLVTQQLHAVQGTPRWQASDFVRLRVLGQGKYATTHLVRRQEDGVLLCNKQIALERFSTGLERIVDEVKLLMLLVDHPHIVQYVCSFVSGGMLNIVTEFADEGSLQQQLDRRRERQEPMEEADVLDIFVQTLLALEHLHSKQVLHRDLKPGNIFFDRRRMVRLGDFGIARLMGDGLVQTVIGTPLYLPPEVIQGKPYGVSADVWAMGTVFYEMVALRHPFASDNLAALALAITKVQYEPLSSVVRMRHALRQASSPELLGSAAEQPTYSAELLALPSTLLQAEPAARPSAAALLRTPLINTAAQELEGQLVRMGASARYLHSSLQPAAAAPAAGAAAAPSADQMASPTLGVPAAAPAAMASSSSGATPSEEEAVGEGLARWEAKLALVLAGEALERLQAEVEALGRHATEERAEAAAREAALRAEAALLDAEVRELRAARHRGEERGADGAAPRAATAPSPPRASPPGGGASPPLAAASPPGAASPPHRSPVLSPAKPTSPPTAVPSLLQRLLPSSRRHAPDRSLTERAGGGGGGGPAPASAAAATVAASHRAAEGGGRAPSRDAEARSSATPSDAEARSSATPSPPQIVATSPRTDGAELGFCARVRRRG